MDAQQFRLLVDQCFRRLSKAFEDGDPDEIECTTGDGVASLEFGDGTRFMVSRQAATNQLWLAAGARAWHYDYNAERGTWLCDRDGHEFYQKLAEVVSAKLGRSVSI
jgi:CyaY protein